MAKRILLAIRTTDARSVAATLDAARLARESGGIVRLMYVSPGPPPGRDGHDRQMRPIAQALEALVAACDGVPVDSVVRFGRLGCELKTEAEVFGADLLALVAPTGTSLYDRLTAWYLARLALACHVPLVLLPAPSPIELRLSASATRIWRVPPPSAPAPGGRGPQS